MFFGMKGTIAFGADVDYHLGLSPVRYPSTKLVAQDVTKDGFHLLKMSSIIVRDSLWKTFEEFLLTSFVTTCHLHVYTSFSSTQVWHSTLQHQMTLQWQEFVKFFTWTLCPRPQHNISQLLPLIQILPLVPGEYLFFVQKSGDVSKYTRSRFLSPKSVVFIWLVPVFNFHFSRLLFCLALLCLCWGGKSVVSPEWPLLMNVSVLPSMAESYFFLSCSPVLWKSANCFQQILVVHVPETPWHLHFLETSCLTT